MYESMREVELEEFLFEVQKLANKNSIDFAMMVEGGRFVCSSTKGDADVNRVISTAYAKPIRVETQGHTFLDIYRHYVYDLDYECGVGDVCYIPIYPDKIGQYPKWFIKMTEDRSKFGLSIRRSVNDMITTVCGITFKDFDEKTNIPAKCEITSYLIKSIKAGDFKVDEDSTKWEKKEFYTVTDIELFLDYFIELFGNNAQSIKDVLLQSLKTNNHEEE